MARKLGLAAIAVGAFLLVLAVLSRTYVYGQLAVAPANQNTTSTSATAPGQDATYLDLGAEGGPEVVTGPLESVRVTTGDVEASQELSDERGTDVVVWDTYVCTDVPSFDCASGRTPLSGTEDRVAFDAHTGEAVQWSGSVSSSGGATGEAEFAGQYFKFPFDTRRTTYDFWDGTLRRALPATYVGETTIDGLDVYEFRQTIEPAKSGTIAVPGSLVGEDDTDTVEADRMYSNTRTLFVEPVTGVIVRGAENQDSYLSVDGERRLTTTKASLTFTEDYTRSVVEEYASKATLLQAAHTTFPLFGGLVGLALIVAGALALVRRSRADDDPKSHRRASDLVGARS